MNIQEIVSKIKPALKEWTSNETVFLATLLLVVAGTSFGLGRYSAMDTTPASAHNGSRVTVSSVEASGAEKHEAISGAESKAVPQADLNAKGQYVGSKNSNKYHLPWCSGAQTISEQNKVWFASKADAESKGYVAAANCKGI